MDSEFKVAICATKGSPKDNIYRSLKSGCKSHGCAARICHKIIEVQEFAPHGIIQVSRHGMKGNRKRSNVQHSRFRASLFQYAEKHNLRSLFIERSYLDMDKYYAVSFDHIKNYGEHFNQNSPPDRWESFGIKLHPWREVTPDKSQHVILLCSNRQGPSIDFQYDKWEYETAKWLNKHSKREIWVRKHPNNFLCGATRKLIQQNAHVIADTRPLHRQFINAWCCVASTSNAAVRAIIHGIPVITKHLSCMAYEVAEHQLENMANPAMPDRMQWLYNLAYAQWHEEEIKEGVMWERMKHGFK